MLSRTQRALVLTFYNALAMMATPKALAAVRYTAGDSDPSEKMLHAITILAAHINGQSGHVAALPQNDPQQVLWHGELCRAVGFARELVAGFRADPEHAADVAELTAHSVPHGLAQRIVTVLLIARDELGQAAQLMEQESPALRDVMVAQSEAYRELQVNPSMFAPEEAKR